MLVWLFLIVMFYNKCVSYHDYDSTCYQSKLSSEKVTVLLENIKPEACNKVKGPQQQSLCGSGFLKGGSG